MQGIMGVVESQRSSATSFFLSARYFASLTAVVVLPLPGLPQTASTCAPLSCCTSGSGSSLRLNKPPFLKFSIYATSLSAGGSEGADGWLVSSLSEELSASSADSSGYSSESTASCASVNFAAFSLLPR